MHRVWLASPVVITLLALTTGIASASTREPDTDRGVQCSGTNIVGLGATLQAPAQSLWNTGFNYNSSSSAACSGSQGSGGTPSVDYFPTPEEFSAKHRGSGACLRAFGADQARPSHEYSFCGTDEAPNATQKEEIEGHKIGGEGESLETIPVLQGSVAVIVHLPEDCKASAANVVLDEKEVSLGRLVLNDSTVDGIFAGTIKTWHELLTAQTNDNITCANEGEKNDTIQPVVRTDDAGTTHIFKEYLSLADPSGFEMEPYKEAYGKGSAESTTNCGGEELKEFEGWREVAEGCQNQRWPLAAHVIRNEEAVGDQGEIGEVALTPSSIGYASLAIAREERFFSSKADGGGENAKGEQNEEFWAPIQNSTEVQRYSDPSSKGDTEKLASSNCKNTDYVERGEKEFPPASTRALWNEGKAALTEENYPICGLTYDITYREFRPYLLDTPFEGEGKAMATTVENYLMYELSTKGGGKEIKNHDYEALPTEVRERAEDGVAEIGYEIP